jgi:hypothetical protein
MKQEITLARSIVLSGNKKRETQINLTISYSTSTVSIEPYIEPVKKFKNSEGTLVCNRRA